MLSKSELIRRSSLSMRVEIYDFSSDEKSGERVMDYSEMGNFSVVEGLVERILSHPERFQSEGKKTIYISGNYHNGDVLVFSGDLENLREQVEKGKSYRDVLQQMYLRKEQIEGFLGR